MNISESNAVHTLLGFLMPELNNGGPVAADEAGEAAAFLANRARRAVSAGPSRADVDELWQPFADLVHVATCAECGGGDEPPGRPVETLHAAGGLL